jgi:hypothetical protein
VKKLAAEFVGTFALVFAGTGAIVIDETTGGTVTHVGVALTFGLIVLAMIYTVGDISGAPESCGKSGISCRTTLSTSPNRPIYRRSVLRSVGG